MTGLDDAVRAASYAVEVWCAANPAPAQWRDLAGGKWFDPAPEPVVVTYVRRAVLEEERRG